jgi:hypothetical protein
MAILTARTVDFSWSALLISQPECSFARITALCIYYNASRPVASHASQLADFQLKAEKVTKIRLTIVRHPFRPLSIQLSGTWTRWPLQTLQSCFQVEMAVWQDQDKDVPSSGGVDGSLRIAATADFFQASHSVSLLVLSLAKYHFFCVHRSRRYALH